MKRFFAVLLTLAMVFSIASVCIPAVTVMAADGDEIRSPKKIISVVYDDSGSMNGDGSVNTKDANIIKRVISGVLIPTEDVLRLCDVNGDGSINTKDTNVIKRMISGILILTHKPL